MKQLVIVGVGPLDVNQLSDLIRQRYVYDFNAPGSYEKTVYRLLEDLHEKLGYKKPMVLPATVFAITRDQTDALNQIENQLARVTALYRQAGINQEEDWDGAFSSRYRETPESFSPFSNEDTIKDMFQSVLCQVNQVSGAGKKIVIRWYERQQLVAATDEGDQARNEWRRDCHVLIIDAVSLLIKTIADDLTSVLSLTRNELRRAVVWIPPFTSHAGHLEDMINQIEKPLSLRSLLQDWKTRPECCVTFDAATNVSLRRWLAYVLRDLSAPLPPLKSNLAMLEQNAGRVGITPDIVHTYARSESLP